MFIVRFQNPGMSSASHTEHTTLRQAQARVGQYARKYGRSPGYVPATIVEAKA